MANRRFPDSLLRWLGAIALASLLACLTPSIPIPPPSPERMAFELSSEDGTATFTYGPDSSLANAVVYVFNRTQGVGVIVSSRGDGSVGPTNPFAGQVGDEVVVTFELDTLASSACVLLADGQSSSARECDL